MKELNKAFNAHLINRIDIADLKILVRKRINELKRICEGCQYKEQLKIIEENLKYTKIKGLKK